MKTYNSVAEYMDAVSDEEQQILNEIGLKIKALVPEGVECINYGMPCIKYKDKALVYYAAFKNHFTFFTGDGSTVARFLHRLDGFETTKSGIHFHKNKPIPDDILHEIVSSRMSDIEFSLETKKAKGA